jgi:hypothetical protein
MTRPILQTTETLKYEKPIHLQKSDVAPGFHILHSKVRNQHGTPSRLLLLTKADLGLYKTQSIPTKLSLSPTRCAHKKNIRHDRVGEHLTSIV